MIDQAVRDFLNALEPELRRRAVFPFEAEERLNWHYIPRQRNGVPLKSMTEGQREAAMALLRAALSERGYSRAEDIMRLENVLAEIERDPETYGPLNYNVTVFGEPGAKKPWGWRIDGHHLSLNFAHTPDGIAVTPAFFGANPANVEHGPHAGLRVLGGEEDLGRELIRGLPDAQRDRAVIARDAFDDIITGPGREGSLQRPAGLALGAMDDAHRNLAMRIIEEFVGTMRTDMAEAERARIGAAGLGRIHFAWAGSLEPRQPHYYRLHGPNLLIEYDNTQNDANHIHSVWHDPGHDFATDLLRRHYQHHRHRVGHRLPG
ncbi:MAG: DUF3500 domain-containing protein [Alphaproteobacteria bacterium]|nr:DUF3500 domain-containing protein [Alphaproteobacteria bacterium]